jgi:hypothetical protein
MFVAHSRIPLPGRVPMQASLAAAARHAGSMTHPSISGAQDPDERSSVRSGPSADALVMAIERSDATLADTRVAPRVRELLYGYVDELREAGLPPERMLVAVKEVLHRARRRRSAEYERHLTDGPPLEVVLVTAAIRRYYAPRD